MSTLGWKASWRIAWRDLRTGLRGLRLLFICLFLGVGTLTTISSLTIAITDEIANRGQVLLGGDIEISMMQREASAAEKAQLRPFGRFSETIRMRAMARSVAAGGPAVLAELKGVDGSYPLYGTLTLQDGRFTGLAADAIVIDPVLAQRMNLSPGDHLRFGTGEFTIAGLIADEPDRVGEGFTLGPVAIVSMEGLRRTGLIQPGSLFEAKYRLAIAPQADPANLREELEERFAGQAWEFKDRDRAAPGTSRFFERLGQFLTLIGLTALVIAGIGIGNGVRSYLAMRRGSIATFKVLGATSADIERVYLLQIGAVVALSIAAGLTAGVLAPPAVVTLAGDALPVQPELRLYAQPILASAAYGFLVALMCAFPPLARARLEPAASIFRGAVGSTRRWDRRVLAIVATTAISLIVLVLATAHEVLFSAAVLAAIAGVLLLLTGLGLAVRKLAQKLPRPRRPLLRLAVANLHRPGAQTSALIVALGLSLTLFVTLAGIQTSLDAEIENTVPETAPNLVVLDIPVDRAEQFRALATGTEINLVPSLRGTVVAYGGKRVADLAELPEGAWILRGERGITYSATLPEGSELEAGEWWPADYRGSPLVSLDAEQAGVLGVTLGDSITVSMLGREITARIASLRRINWDNMGFNYLMVFSPNTLQSAPHSLTATVTLPPEHEDSVSRSLLEAFPGISIIAVGEVIDQIGDILEQMSGAIVASASITVLAGTAVLAGAIAASHQARAYDSVILKTLGASRAQVLGAQIVEYALLAAALALIALVLGTLAAWFVIVQVFEFDWAPDWRVIGATLAGGSLLTLAIGLAGSLPLLSASPARALREL